jgi:hypothetical protein
LIELADGQLRQVVHDGLALVRVSREQEGIQPALKCLELNFSTLVALTEYAHGLLLRRGRWLR